MEDKKPSFRIFPTKHPFVKNKDGTRSNVKLATFSFGEGDKEMHFVIPTMVGGKQLTNDEAVAKARQMGLKKYPKFKTQKEANAYSKQIHSSINEQGFLLK
jgi:metallophosphoesterase superfamily enzyme|tara:strand:- start:292 stop:594 length:303 start_codon:yes stop_codon:yes gene_type:complete